MPTVWRNKTQRNIQRKLQEKVVVLEVAWDMRELVGIKSVKWWKIILVKWLSPRVMVEGILGPLPWRSALQTHLPLPDFAWPRGFWGSFQKDLFPLVYAGHKGWPSLVKLSCGHQRPGFRFEFHLFQDMCLPASHSLIRSQFSSLYMCFGFARFLWHIERGNGCTWPLTPEKRSSLRGRLISSKWV